MTLTEQYTEALLEGTKRTDAGTALSRLKAVLKQRGHFKLWRGVLKNALVRAERQGKASEFRVAKKEDASRFAQELAGFDVSVSADTATVDDTLIGGFVYRDKERLVDGSYKRALIDLYTKMTQ